MSLKWRVARVRAMSTRELGFRVARLVRASAERWGVGLARAPDPRGPTGPAWVASLPRHFDASRYAAAADRILVGRFNVFALRDVPLGFPPPWNRDPKTGTTAPLVFGKTLDYRKPGNVGDIKYLWEINRHLELVTLAQAWHLTGDRRFAEGCRTLVDSWVEQCPYPLGANWCSSLEHAFRLVSWACAWHLLGADQSPLFTGPDGQAFRARWLTSVYQHCHFIAGHRSRHSSANNHLIGESTGLLVGAATWPMWEASSGWRGSAIAELERQSELQTFADGVNREQAVWYHHAVAEMLLVAGLFVRAGGGDFSAAYWSRLEAMLEFLASIMDAGGNLPSIGDADDGVLVRFAPARSTDSFRSLLATGAVLFGRPDFKAKAGGLDDKTRWLLGDDADIRFATLDNSAVRLPVRRAFPHAGYYVLGTDFETAREVRIVADAGPLGFLSIAAHGHADALSFTLSAAGLPILIDPGTYAYHAGRAWRDYFRGTSAHNTVRIDGLDQSVPGGNFLWLTHAQATVEQFSEQDGRDTLVASHDGYERLPASVRHRRTWEYERARSTLVIRDELIGAGTHAAEWFWHFAPGCGVVLRGNSLLARRDGVTVTLIFPPQLACRLEAGSEHPPLGWSSDALDSKVPSVTAVMTGEVGETRDFQFELRVGLN